MRVVVSLAYLGILALHTMFNVQIVEFGTILSLYVARSVKTLVTHKTHNQTTCIITHKTRRQILTTHSHTSNHTRDTRLSFCRIGTKRTTTHHLTQVFIQCMILLTMILLLIQACHPYQLPQPPPLQTILHLVVRSI